MEEKRYCHLCNEETDQHLEKYDPDATFGSEKDLDIWYCEKCENYIDFKN